MDQLQLHAQYGDGGDDENGTPDPRCAHLDMAGADADNDGDDG
jgi:hypothetical protein